MNDIMLKFIDIQEKRKANRVIGRVNILDTHKVKEMLKKYGEVKVGASDDWFYTAQTLTKGDIPDLLSGKKSLLRTSDWDTFKIVLPNGEEVDATITVDENIYNIIHACGVSTVVSQLDIWFDNDIYFSLIRKLKYEQLKEMTNKVKPILREYIKEV